MEKELEEEMRKDEEEILEEEMRKEIENSGYFLFYPERWGVYDDVIKRLLEKGEIISCDGIINLKTFANTCYMYTFSGNPFNLKIVKNGLYARIEKG